MKIVLASASPRRAELLKQLYTDFEIAVADICEVSEKTLPCEIVCDLAEQKARAVLSNYEDCTVIAADTLVFVDEKQLGKPKDEEDAMRMLTMLSGRTHEVITGVAVAFGTGVFSCYDITKVTFAEMSEEEKKAYIKSGDPFDKAGGYGIQSGAGVYIIGIEGCYFNVMGLPLNKLYRFINEIRT